MSCQGGAVGRGGVLVRVDRSGRFNPAARAFGVSGLTQPAAVDECAGTTRTGGCDQHLVDLAGEVALRQRMISGLLRPSAVRRST
jgi:hypothetical protein